MTPSGDERLRARLAALSDAVPVKPVATQPRVHGQRVRPTARTMGLPGALGMAALIVLIAVGATWLVVRTPTIPGSSVLMSMATDGDFQLTLRVDKSTYAANEPVSVDASLVYRGPEAQLQIGFDRSPIIFGLEQLDGSGTVDQPLSDLMCMQQRLEKDQPLRVSINRAGIESGSNAGASPFPHVYANPQLRPATGTWRVYAEASFEVASTDGQPCDGVSHLFRTGVVVTVGEPQSMPSPTVKGPDRSFPGVCADLEISLNQCAGFAAWAVGQSGIAPGHVQRIDMTRSTCPGVSPCPSGAQGYVVSVHLVTDAGRSSDQVVNCTFVPGSLGAINFLCGTITMGDGRILQYPGVASPISGGYRDTPCTGEGPTGCATPLPSIEPSAEAAAKPLAIDGRDIPIDHAGAYSIVLGEATLPNGILTAASADITSSPADPLVSYDGYALDVTSLDGGPPFQNYYAHGFRPGVEHVRVTLTFSVVMFQPGAVVHLANVDVH